MNSEILERYNLKVNKCSLRKKIKIIDTDNGSYVIKDVNKDKKVTYDYLNTREFYNYPKVINDLSNDGIEICEYVEDFLVPKEQREEDLLYLIGLLHNKTTFYKEMSLDEIKKIYEDYSNRFYYLENYYLDLQNVIEKEEFMSPANYLLIRNISKIYYLLYLGKNYLEQWYKIVSTNKRFRYCLIHGNIDASHLIENSSVYLISWDHAKVDLPINDLYDFYRKNYKNVDFKRMIDIYRLKANLHLEEEYFLKFRLCLVDKVSFIKSEIEMVDAVYNLVCYTDKTLDVLKQDTKEPTYNK